jgi:hypothetical protein
VEQGLKAAPAPRKHKRLSAQRKMQAHAVPFQHRMNEPTSEQHKSNAGIRFRERTLELD